MNVRIFHITLVIFISKRNKYLCTTHIILNKHLLSRILNIQIDFVAQLLIGLTTISILYRVFLPLKETDAEGRRIILFRQSSYNPDKHHMDDVLKAMYLVVDVFLETDEIYQITGVVLILDMKGLTTGHMLQFPPTVMKKCMLLWQVGSIHQVR